MLIKGGRLIDPAQRLDGIFDLRIRGGIIDAVGEDLAPEAGEPVFDATNTCVAPGFIDMHVHLREPGFPEKETIATGTAAALAGGFTAVACMPNTNPAIDSTQTIAQIMQLATASRRARVYPVAAITRGRNGTELLDYASLQTAGAVAFSDDGNTVMNAKVLRDAAIAARAVAGCFISHCEDDDLKGDAVMHLGDTSKKLGVSGSPAIAEDLIVARDLQIAKETGKPWHIAHLSTRGGIALVEWTRAQGGHPTCEVAPHHLLFIDESLGELGARGKVNPPLRQEEDAAALRAAVREGKIDVFATDHAPHTDAEKSGDLAAAAVGFSGLEIAIGAYALAVPDLPVSRFVELLATNPARILGVPGGTLKLGEPGDLTIFAERKWTVDSKTFQSKGRATPFDGMTFSRSAVATIVGGELRMQDGRLVGS
ncbi:MAG: dihydroorotase [Candidatus Eremiobacteraeota bacterium]|nr:dihydroorotase [Candidatus Eremiobacteraeota bacterium]